MYPTSFEYFESFDRYFSANFLMFYSGLLYSQYTNHSFDLVLIMVILYKTKLTTTLSIVRSNQFSVTHY